jgi:hypothetical protein
VHDITDSSMLRNGKLKSGILFILEFMQHAVEFYNVGSAFYGRIKRVESRRSTESKAEVKGLRERLSVRTPTVHKDFSLISLVPKWFGSE